MSHSAKFLHYVEPPEVHRPHRIWRIAKMVFLGALVLFLVWLAVMGAAAVHTVSASLDGRDALYRARDAATELRFDVAANELEAAQVYFERADRGVFVLQSAAFIPWVGDQLQAVRALVVSGERVIDVLIDVVDLGAEIVRISGLGEEQLKEISSGVSVDSRFNELSLETKRAILQRLSHTASDLSLTEAKIALARQELASIQADEVIAPIVSALQPLDEKLEQFQEIVHTFSIAAHLLPEFAGLGSQKTFLILFLNNNELRPGGGFTGTYGTVDVHDGELLNVQAQDVYRLDDAAAHAVNTVPPKPLQTYLGADKWFFRDANWSPDFVKSTEKQIELFQYETSLLEPEVQEVVQKPIPINGVVAMTPAFASEILKITGTLEAEGERFTPENFFETLEYQVEYGFEEDGIAYNDRKNIIADLVDQVKDRLFALKLREWVRLVEVVQEGLRTKQLVIFSADDKAQQVIERVGWGGRVSPKAADVQMVVDANLASLKTDDVMERAIQYEIFRNTSGQYIGRTTIHYQHNGGFDWKTTRYRTYTRLYVPEGSELIRVSGSQLNDKTKNPTGAPAPVDVENDLGLTSFGTFTSVEPGQGHKLVFEYVLADSVVQAIEDKTYSLDVIKQIGAKPHALTLDLDFDKNITYASPSEAAEQWGDDVYVLQTELDQDKAFSVSF